MTRHYITVEVTADVDVSIEEVLDGMSVEDKRELIRDIQKDLAFYNSPRVIVSLESVILERHRREHAPGPIWACLDGVCDAWAVTEGAS